MMPPIRPPTNARPSRSALASGAAVDAIRAVISVMKSKLFIAIVLACEKFDFCFRLFRRGPRVAYSLFLLKNPIFVSDHKNLFNNKLYSFSETDRTLRRNLGPPLPFLLDGLLGNRRGSSFW